MTTISTTSISVSVAQLISGGTSIAATAAASAPASSTTASSGAAVFVTFSDQAKAAVAAKAESDQVAADTLQAYVEAHRANTAGTATPTTDNTSTGTPAAQPTTGSKVEAIVAQIKALADADEPPPFQSFTPTKSLSSSVTFDGYTLSLQTNASTQFYGVAVSGNGAQVFDKHFGPSDQAGGGSGAAPGVTIGTAMVDNNEAEEAVTITQNTATASSASISSSSSGSISTSSVSAQSSQITFLVNYATGQISVAQSAASVSAQAARVSPPGSALSTFA